MKIFLFYFLIFGIVIELIGGFESFSFEKCNYSDAQCPIKLLQFFIDQFWCGNEELDLPHLDPLRVNEATLVSQGKGPLNYIFHIRDFDFIGYRECRIIHTAGWSKEFDGTDAEIVLKAPKFTITGPFTIKGNFLRFLIEGSGISNVTLSNVDARMKFKLKKVTKDGKVYATVDKFMVKITTTRMYMHLENIFDGDAMLKEIVDQFIDENWEMIFKDIEPSAMKTFGKIWQDIFNHILSRIPYGEFFND
ncbi:protein takeout-like [Lutzomyia longipalpis]|uniref:protein takeout-like n=1 Tax=Lutzomyia longipalpis TaxID=7200 RepID=UPI002483C31A|nr:protein takeout-like [Lutzomyia longipalpis]